MLINLVNECSFSLKSKGRLKSINRSGIRNFNLKIILVVFLVAITLAGNATIYYISSSGNDSNSGTSSDKPWKTLSKVNNFSFKPGDQILFKKGDAWTGTITVTTSGTSSSPIVFGAYGTGQKPKIYGSEVIAGWTKHSGNIYKASFGESINQLFIDDVRSRAARYPNSGYIFITSTESTTRFTSDELDPGINYSGAKWFGRTYYYTADLKDVSSSSSRSISLSSATRKPLKNGLGFFLMNKLEFLDQAGEWYYDDATNTVYFWTPRGDSPANYTVRGSVHKDGFYLNNADYITIQDIEILQHSEKSIELNKSDYITINNNDLSYPDGFGIYTPSNSAHYSITNNNVIGANHYGMMIRVSYSKISDNTVSKIALLENIGLTGTGADNYGGGIYLAGQDGNNTLSYNRITETGYNGILFANPKNIIEYNFIDGACLLKGDMGGIYTSWYNRVSPAGPEGSIVRNNIVLNVVGEKYGYTSLRDFGEGIYIDESARGVTVENNTIAHCKNSGIYLHQNENTIVRNNTILDTRQSINIVKYSGSVKSNISNNLMFAASNKDDYLQRQVLVNLQSGNTLMDNNKYVNPYASDGIFKLGSPYYNFNEWKSSTGQDKNSMANVTQLKSGEKEKLFYNDTKSDKTINLGSQVYKDIDGNRVTGSFTLKPFTSRILIGTGSETSVDENRSPVVVDQYFEFSAPKKVNDFIGKVDAYDPDAGQELTYTIVSGNEAGLFKLNSTTGELYTQSEISSATSLTVQLIIGIRDNAANPLSTNADVAINIKAGEIEQATDATAPVISSFLIPSTYESLVVPVTVSASDNVAVTGWKLSESSKVPLAGDEGWTAPAPLKFAFSGEGEKTLYAWAKDASGNISASESGTVAITIPNEETTIPDSVESVTICEGMNYLGWTTSGTYERILTTEEKTQQEGINQIGNADFSDEAIGWSSWGDTGYSIELVRNTSDYISTPASMQVSCTANGTLISKLQLTSKSNIHVEAGKDYELSFYAKASVPFTPGKIVLMKRTTPYTYYGSFSGEISEVTTEWSQISLKFTATETATDGSLRFYLGSTLPVGQSLYLDDVSFREVQETTASSDKVVTTFLTVNPVVNTTEEITVANGDNYLGWTDTGEYVRTLVSSTGCDSTVTTNLIVLTSVEPEVQVETEYVTICEGDEYNGWTESGIYEWERTSETGSTLMTTHLTIEATKYVTETVKIWANEEYNGWTEEGHYERVLESASGCDSVVVTKLVVKGKSFNNNSASVISSEPIIGKGSSNDFKIYPNPAQTYIDVEFQSQPEPDTKLEIIDGSGRIVYMQEAGSAINRINFNQLNPGMYFLRSANNQYQKVEKFMIE